MFFNEPLVARRGARLTLPPPIEDTGWRPPTEFPNLSGATWLSFDTETKERDFDNGPGWARGLSHIVGVSIAAADNQGNRGKWYFPMRHEVEPEYNLDPANVLGFVNHTLSTTPTIPKIGAHLTYDIGNLTAEGVKVVGPLHDVQFAEALIDSDAFVALDILGRKYLKRPKTSETMYNWIRRAYPYSPETKLRENIYRTSPRLVGPYAEDDADMPIDIMFKQAPLLWDEQLEYVYRLECDLIPLMVRMRFEGVTVNTGKAAQMLDLLKGETQELYKRVYYEYGRNIGSTSSAELGALFDHVGVKYPRNRPTDRNPDGSPQIQKEWLAALEHPLGDLINEIREHEKICGTFIESYILNKSIPIPGSNSLAKLFPQFHQMKNDENGTFVGRYASSDPNLQNIPSRTLLGKRVRECFENDFGHYGWRKFDYSQIHYRILAHNAVDEGDGSAEALRERYRNDPKTDYHQDVYMNVAPRIGWSITDPEIIKAKRRIIKNVNFSLLYGVGKRALAYKYLTGMTSQEVETFFNEYYAGAPYVKPTMEMIAQEVQQQGYVTTLLGRRIRFKLFEPLFKDYDNPAIPLPYHEAIAEYGSPLKRAFDYRGVNYKFQGSEPDLMKKGMRDCLNSGVFDYTGVPRLTVHDELDFSVRDDSPQMREAFDFIRHTMQNSIQMRVPVYVDESNGPNWGKAE